MYISKNRSPKLLKQKLIELKGEIDKSIITARDVKNPLFATDKATRQKIRKHLEELNNVTNQQDLICYI